MAIYNVELRRRSNALDGFYKWIATPFATLTARNDGAGRNRKWIARLLLAQKTRNDDWLGIRANCSARNDDDPKAIHDNRIRMKTLRTKLSALAALATTPLCAAQESAKESILQTDSTQESTMILQTASQDSFLHAIIEPFAYDFVWMALLTCVLVSICVAMVGSIIVSNRSVFVAGGVAHSAFGGVGLALYFGFSATLGALAFAVALALFLAYAKLKSESRLDAYIGATWSFGMALGIVLMDLSPGYNSDLASYLFGSIISVSRADLWAIFAYDAALFAFVATYYRELLGVFYDKEFCALKGIRASAFLVAIFAFIAVGVVMSMSVAGLVLVLALMSIPAYIAGFFTRSLKGMMAMAFLVSLAFLWGGFFVSYALDVSPGAMIVLLLCVGMISVVGAQFFKNGGKNGCKI